MSISRAQMRFLDSVVPAQLHWLKSGVEIGASSEPKNRRSMASLIRKNILRFDGQITEAGLKSYERKVKRMRKRENELVTSAGSRDQSGQGVVVGVE